MHLSDDGLLAGVAASLLGGLDSLAAHVCSERSEHMLKRGGFGLPRTAAVVLLPRALLAIHVGSALAACAAYLRMITLSFKTLSPLLLTSFDCLIQLCSANSR